MLDVVLLLWLAMLLLLLLWLAMLLLLAVLPATTSGAPTALVARRTVALAGVGRGAAGGAARLGSSTTERTPR